MGLYTAMKILRKLLINQSSDPLSGKKKKTKKSINKMFCSGNFLRMWLQLLHLEIYQNNIFLKKNIFKISAQIDLKISKKY
jgi:hypothetical protein